ncbi:MAG: hypothetical protein CMK59_12480 [Proteobacteria bacterium]|nr:hypothetical protein [Pseudomonadota bacterium]
MIDFVVLWKYFCKAADPRIKDRMFLSLLWLFSMSAHHFWEYAKNHNSDIQLKSKQKPSQNRHLKIRSTVNTLHSAQNNSNERYNSNPPLQNISPAEESNTPELLNETKAWIPYTSPPITLVLDVLKEKNKPSADQLFKAYIDLDVEALRRFEGKSLSEKEAIKTDFLNEFEKLQNIQPQENETPEIFLGRLNRAIHTLKGLRYRSDHNTVSSYTHNKRLQCSSASTLLLLLFQHHAKHFPQATPVFVFSANPTPHAQPGVLIEHTLYVTEATAKSGRIESVPMDLLEHVIVAKADDYLTALVAHGAGQGTLFDPQKSVIKDTASPALEKNHEEQIEYVLPFSLLGAEGQPSAFKDVEMSPDADPVAWLKKASTSNSLIDDIRIFENIFKDLPLYDLPPATKRRGALLLYKDLNISKSLNQEDIEQTLNRFRIRYVYCYSREKSVRNHQGSMVLKFNLTTSQKHNHVNIESSSYYKESFLECIQKNSKRMLSHMNANTSGAFKVRFKFYPQRDF